MIPVLAVKASRTFWKFSCSEPPHSEVTVIEPPAAGLPAGALPAALPAGVLAGADPATDGAAEPLPEPQAAATSALAMNNETRRSDRFIDHLR